MVVHRFNDHIREDLARIRLDKTPAADTIAPIDTNGGAQLAPSAQEH